jgi:glycosyltransferase involved in cell wall biosynthesis
VSGAAEGRPPRVAVIVPCFDDGATLEEAVASVHQNEPVELVIVDDGSADPATCRILERLQSAGVRVVRHERNRGLIEARMTGLAATSAPFVLPLDADDCVIAGAIESMADALEADPGAAACCGDYEEFGESKLVRAVPEQLDPYRIAYTNEYPVTSLFRRTVLEEVNAWRHDGSELPSYEDWHLWMKLAGRGARIVHLGPGRVTYRRRLHPGQRARMLDIGKAQHRRIYRQLRAANPELFERLREHRRVSPLSPLRKLAYPLVYGGRVRLPFERRVKRLLDRAGIWTLRR